MNEDNRDIEDAQSYALKRVQEVKGGYCQKTFGRPDLDHLEPVMEDLLAGNYRDLKISYTSKEGTKVNVELKGF